MLTVCAGLEPVAKVSIRPKQVEVKVDAQAMERDVTGRLSQLERLQYELTRQVPDKD